MNDTLLVTDQHNRLSYKEISLFFFPLVLNVQLMSISHTIINGALARRDDFVLALAGISVAMIMQLFISSPSYQNHTVTIAMARGRRSLISVAVLIGLTALYVSCVLLILAWTPVGTFVLEELLGTPPEVAVEARKALRIMLFLPFFTGCRGLSQGLLIRARRTGLVSCATGVRVVALFFYLNIGPYWFSGAQLGAFALVSCVITECVLISWLAWRLHLPFPQDAEEKSLSEVLRYAFPLAWSSFLQQTILLLIGSIIGRLHDGAMALAAFGVIRGFLFLLAGPLRNLHQAWLTLVHNERDGQTLLRFSIITASAMSLALLLVAGPFNQLFIGNLLGIEDGLNHYMRLAFASCAIFPLIYAWTNLLRGWFSETEQTRYLGSATLAKSLFLVVMWLPLVYIPLPISGIAIAIGLIIISELIEASYLHVQRRRLMEVVGEGF